jgi:hypothetical protein
MRWCVNAAARFGMQCRQKIDFPAFPVFPAESVVLGGGTHPPDVGGVVSRYLVINIL